MNDRISIKGINSYDPNNSQDIDISKKNVLIYGLNGTGKSTISNFFYLDNCEKNSFDHCLKVIEGSYTPLVYNQLFIEDNFVNSSDQLGIFTLSKVNVNIEKRILHLSQRKEKLSEAYKTVKGDLASLQTERSTVNQNAINEIYKKKQQIEKTSLKPFLAGFIGTKQKFYNKVISINLEENINIEELSDEFTKLNSYKGKNIQPLILPNFPILSPDDNSLLNQPIIGSNQSQLHDFITELGNQSWVKEGQELYLKNEQNKCPFCQNATINDLFRRELTNLFDESYEINLAKIKEIKSRYETDTKRYVENITEEFTQCPVYDSNKSNIEFKIESIKLHFAKNLEMISEKIKKPIASVVLENSEGKHKDFEDQAIELNKIIAEVNEKTSKIDESITILSSKMWGALKFQSKDILLLEKQFISEINKKKIKYQNRLERIKIIGQSLRDKITDLGKNTSVLDESIIKINNNLAYLGITGFTIVKSEDPEKENYFKLSRSDKRNNQVFRSLSEGEKTLVTFLYFLELCTGSIQKDDTSPDSDKLIVIDDPISSLSQNYLYDIAFLIHSRIIKKQRFKKVIVLTHSLFFFHELLKMAPDKTEDFDASYALYRITKNEYSQILEMNRAEIKNDYQSLWHILNDTIKSNTNPIMLPNVMRNILEYYYAFVHKKDKLHEVLNSLTEQENNPMFRSFYRYINRESHSDSCNIDFMASIDPNLCLERFKQVFNDTGDIAHYELMIH